MNSSALLRHMLRPLLLLVVLMTAGCGTQAYYAMRSQCSPEAYRRFPVVYQVIIVQDWRDVQVPVNNSCTSTPQGRTCTQQYRTIRQPFDRQVTRDINEAGRNAYTSACAENMCMSRYGNRGCETPDKK